MEFGLTLLQQRICAIEEELQMLATMANELPEPYRSEIKADLLAICTR